MIRTALVFLLTVAASIPAQADRLRVAAGVAIEDPWVRPTFGKVTATAGYVTLVDMSGEGDTLIAVQAKAGNAELHDTTVEGGIMKMRARANVPIPPRGRLALKPGEMHIMVTGLTSALNAGETFPITLRFAKQGDVTVNFIVRVPQ